MYQRFERFSFAIFEISRHWHRLTGDEMEKYGLKSSHSVYLLALARTPQGLTAPQLCEICGKDKSDVSRMMAILEKKGLVSKEGPHQNRYAGAYLLTQDGREVAQALRTRASRAVEIAGRDLSPAQRESFYDALESIAMNMREMSEPGMF